MTKTNSTPQNLDEEVRSTFVFKWTTELRIAGGILVFVSAEMLYSLYVIYHDYISVL